MNPLAPLVGDWFVSAGCPTTRMLLACACLAPLILIWMQSRQRLRPTRRASRAVAGFATACALGAIAAWPAAPAAQWVLLGSVALLAAIGLSVARLNSRDRDLGWRHHVDRLRILDSALNASRDGVLVTATNSGTFGLQIIYANPAFEELTGYGTDEALGQSPSMLYNQSPPKDREVVHEALRAGTPGRFEVLARRKDGSRVWVEWNIVPVSESGDGCAYRIAVLRDTTERKRLEDQLCQAAKLEAVGQLAAGVAHDFNNLLTVIGGNVDLLRTSTARAPETAHLVDEIGFAADRAVWLVRQLLTFSRPRVATPELIDLGRTVSDFGAIIRRVVGTGIATEIVIPEAPVLVEMDRVQLEQVLMNLSVNARDAMPQGGQLRLSVQTVAGAPRIEVSDSGEGMTEKVKARLFEPFFTTKGPAKGTGLGLATVHQIVKRCGGTIAVESALGSGTTFRIELPRSKPAPPSHEIAEPTEPISRSKPSGSILLVEDEPGVRTLARAVLEGSGYHVTEAADGVEALELLDAGRAFDLVLTDVTMPGATGDEVAARAREYLPNVGIVFMSAYTEVEPSVPGSIFLSKPFSPTSLGRAVEQVLSAVTAQSRDNSVEDYTGMSAAVARPVSMHPVAG
ncbi:MAG: PAS domain-containing protein [Planctomycetes bacterium]|nr:PAS domain-containing protein [Planctomycetota bacterium]